MEYLTFAEYTAMGGTAIKAESFPLANSKAKNKLDYLTRGRIGTDLLPDFVKPAMMILVDGLEGLRGDRLSSYSNGTSSFSFETQNDEMAELLTEVSEIIPVAYMSSVVLYEG